MNESQLETLFALIQARAEEAAKRHAGGYSDDSSSHARRLEKELLEEARSKEQP